MPLDQTVVTEEDVEVALELVRAMEDDLANIRSKGTVTHEQQADFDQAVRTYQHLRVRLESAENRHALQEMRRASESDEDEE